MSSSIICACTCSPYTTPYSLFGGLQPKKKKKKEEEEKLRDRRLVEVVACNQLHRAATNHANPNNHRSKSGRVIRSCHLITACLFISRLYGYVHSFVRSLPRHIRLLARQHLSMAASSKKKKRKMTTQIYRDRQHILSPAHGQRFRKRLP